MSSLALLPFLTSGPDLGVWPDCWVSVEFLHALYPWKGSGTTTTILIATTGKVHDQMLFKKILTFKFIFLKTSTLKAKQLQFIYVINALLFLKPK